MKFNGIESKIKCDLGDELRELAEQFLRDEYIKISKQRKFAKEIEEKYKAILDTEITEEYLYNKGYYVKPSKIVRGEF